MAKFSACFHLCPLIDQKSFLGVMDESVNGCVIITLGKNMVIRYKLSDQKQVSSWSTGSKDKLSAPVVYDAVSQRYIGVFNTNQLSTWEESCVHLKELKKLKFTSAIDRVLTSPCSAEPVVVFRSGHVAPLQQALDRRQQRPPRDPLLSEGETINDAHLVTLIGTVVVALFTTTAQNVHLLHLLPVGEGLLTPSCLQLRRKSENDVKLIGHTLVAHESCYLLTLWSDGQLFSVELPTREPEQFPGRSLATLAFISHRHPAAILPLSPTHVAVYGADASEEGALLFIFNTQLCVTQCKQYFKLYTTPARLWEVGSSAVLLAAGQYLAVVPYQLGKQRLAALVGSQEGDAPPTTMQEWGDQAEDDEEHQVSTQHLQKLLQMYMEEGMSQRMISQSLFLPTLDACDVEGLTSLVKSLNDIPESCILSVIMFCLKDIEKEGYRELLRRVLLVPVTPDLPTLRLLRSRLGLGYVLQLLRELTDTLLDTPGEPRLIEWATLLLDAHYQQYLLSRDKAVIEVLTELKAVVDDQIEKMEVWKDLEALLLQLKTKQGLSDHGHSINNTYSIEQIKLY
ncbi:nucleolar protein 11-like [Macrosteles quadrilineatus]|uniref:nucleolar protein 11-like n=1 Tax=Macrosteles quadrilineatus TaxID=74068 RepID=UPI0023E2959F|nr:nucleolar protein 11-like [Macrosteles quadrilineatus]